MQVTKDLNELCILDIHVYAKSAKVCVVCFLPFLAPQMMCMESSSIDLHHFSGISVLAKFRVLSSLVNCAPELK